MAKELCNCRDDNCNGQIDEEVQTTYYRDADKDTYGNPAVTTQACAMPSGYVQNDDDCNDADSFVHEACSACTIKIIPIARWWFLGEREKIRQLLVIGAKGSFNARAAVRFDSPALKLAGREILSKSTMLLSVTVDRAAQTYGRYRALIGLCMGVFELRR